MDYKRLYDTLLETEELYLIFPSLSGDWEKDKTKFIKKQQQTERDVLHIEVEDDDIR